MGMLDLFREWQQSFSSDARPRRRTRMLSTEQLEVRRMLTPVVVGTTLDVNAATNAPITLNQTPTGVSVIVDSQTNVYLSSMYTINAINIVGAAGGDQININNLLGATVLTVNGGNGNNTLTATTQANMWAIMGPNSGTLNGNSFSNIQNLVGGGYNDDFQFQMNGFVAGHVDGGGGLNALDYSTRTVGAVVNLGTDSATAIGSGFTNITDFLGSADNTDLLIGANMPNTWTISAGNSGNINGLFYFSGVENLTGGVSNDRFVLGPNGFVGGTISGGSGNNSLDYSTRTAGVVTNLSVNQSTALGVGFNQIGLIVGANSTDNLLVGSSATTTWNISNVIPNAPLGNAGNVSTALTSMNFSGFQNLLGGTGNDTFHFAIGAFIAGTVNGGGGYNTLDYSGRSAGIVLNLSANSSTAIGGGYFNIQNLVGSGTGNDTLIGANVTNDWYVTGANSGNLNGTFFFSSINNLTGGTMNDTFHFSPFGFVTGVVYGGLGLNTLDYSQRYNGVIVKLQPTTGQLATGAPTLSNALTLVTGQGLKFAVGENINVFSSGTMSTFNIIGIHGDQLMVVDPTGKQMTPAFQRGATVVQVGSSATAIGGGFQYITNFVGAPHFVNGITTIPNTLVGTDTPNTWSITGSDTGNINNHYTFTGFGNLTGGSGVDIFQLSPSGSLSGLVNGGNNALIGTLANPPMPGMNILTLAPGQGLYFTPGERINVGVPGNSLPFTIGGINGDNLTLDQSIPSGAILPSSSFVQSSTQSGDWLDYSALSTPVTVNLATGVDTYGLTGILARGTALGSNVLTLGTGQGSYFAPAETISVGTPGNYSTFTIKSINGDQLTLTTSVTAAAGISKNASVVQIGRIQNIQNVHGSSSGVNTLTGISQGNALIGGSAVDTITGGNGPSLLIGGLGGDTIKGGVSQNLVIAGYTDYDHNLPALASILAEWQSPNTLGQLGGPAAYGTNVLTLAPGQGGRFTPGESITVVSQSPVNGALTRVNSTFNIVRINGDQVTVDQNISLTNGIPTGSAVIQNGIGTQVNYLRNGGGLNGTVTLIADLTVHSDAAVNSIYGGAGPNWLWGQPTDLKDTAAQLALDTINTPINNPPELTGGGSVIFTATQPPVVIDPGITVASATSKTLASATIQLGANFAANQDNLSFIASAATGNIVGRYNATTGLLTLTSLNSTATVAQWQTALQSVTYNNVSTTPSELPRIVYFQVFDGTHYSDTVQSTIYVNTAPTLVGSSTLAYTTGEAPAVINPGIAVSDPDNNTLYYATVQLTTNFQTFQDVLAFTPTFQTGNIVGNYDSTTGILLLTSAGGTATLAQFQVAMQSVTYQNTATYPFQQTRTVAFQVSDGAAVSNVVTSKITLS